MIFPGVGHVYLGQQRKGIRIAIVFVIISYFSVQIVNYFINSLNIPIRLDFLNLLSFIPIIVFWIWQIFNLLKLIENQSNNKPKLNPKSKS